MNIQELLNLAVTKNASDLHLLVGYPPMLRIDSNLMPVPGEVVLTGEAAEQLLFTLLKNEQKELVLANKEIDFSYEIDGARFRVNIYYQQGHPAGAIRYLPQRIRSIDELWLPQICHQFVTLRSGFILVTGPTGHGKSTTLAAILNEINQTRNVHILTIEDPVEYVYSKSKAVISQREMHTDTHSWSMALRSALREDPDVVLVGEMRDYETIAAALTVAETGHLVFATLHTNSASQTIDRIVDVFPEKQQVQIRQQLASTLEAVLSQRLVPAIGGGRKPATEVLISTPAVRTTIREGKTHLVDNIIQTSGDIGMSLLEVSLANLVKKGVLSLEVAKEYALRPEELMRHFSMK